MDICAVVMAAGEGTRMKSVHSKVVHQVAGKPIIRWVADALLEAGCNEQVYIVGEKQEEIRDILGENVAYVFQEQRLGTGHAVMQAAPFLEGRDGYVIVLPGDSPMVSAKTISKAVDKMNEGDYGAVVITAVAEDPTGYGRLVRDFEGNVLKIVEDKDCSPDEKAIKEINSSMYVFKTSLLLSALGRLSAQNAQKEYYLTDTIEILIWDGNRIGSVVCDIEDTMGVNNRKQLLEAGKIMNRRILEKHMENGVQIIDENSTWIHHAVEIGQDTTILPGTTLMGNTRIGKECIIGENTRLDGVEVGDGTVIDYSVATQCIIGSDCRIGPFSHIRPETKINDHVTIGAYVEVKNSTIDDYTRARHLTYIGDSTVGRNVNFGCGTVTCNFDGQDKVGCIIEDNVFIGGNSNILSSVVLGKDSYIAAGSTITNDVPPLGLGIGRSKQVNKDEWVAKKNRLRGANYIKLDTKRSEL
ncbi:MAG: bifunctional UDP-N-acetylglucosamine diphosphorylase/glucosamine-1-phosphate N-acetyltransferase GlmU [Clostridiales bacterium]|nr:bifunctional UDP-N-acetylglucosamine diphosphorylase/glucosamine-1-phosphate N-acetyltransferase GlmU [Clostridiales bacterium]